MLVCMCTQACIGTEVSGHICLNIIASFLVLKESMGVKEGKTLDICIVFEIVCILFFSYITLKKLDIIFFV